MQTVKARFANGVLEPLDALDLEEGQEVVVSVAAQHPVGHTGRGMRAAAGAWKGTHDPEKLKRVIYAARLMTSRPRPKL